MQGASSSPLSHLAASQQVPHEAATSYNDAATLYKKVSNDGQSSLSIATGETAPASPSLVHVHRAAFAFLLMSHADAIRATILAAETYNNMGR